MKRVVYIILNYKSYQDTVRLTKEILSFGKDEDFIIIVDNCSPNESSKELHKLYDCSDRVDVIDSDENGGYAKGNNFGLRYAKKYSPEYVCVINNDVHFTAETIDALVRIYPKLNKPAIISPIQKLPDGSIPSFAEFKVPDLLYDIRVNTFFLTPKRHIYKSNTDLPNIQKVGYVPGAFLFINYNVFKRIGFFFDKTFLFCEERFTGKMVEEAGLNNYIVMDLSYIHEHSKTISNEASERLQRLLIHRGKKLYYSYYSRCPILSNLLLTVSFIFHECEISIIKLVK